MSLKTIRKFGRWIGTQVDGFVGGVMKLAGTPASAWVPASLWRTFMWVVHSALWSLGTDSPIKQITASVALGIFALLTSWITLGATLVLAAFFAATMVVGFLRLFPVVDRYFVEIRDTVVPRA